jgi:hypothetical protein
MRWAAAHLSGQLIFTLAQVNDMPEQAVRRPFHIPDLDDHFGPDPMNSADHQRWHHAEPDAARNLDAENKRLQQFVGAEDMVKVKYPASG